MTQEKEFTKQFGTDQYGGIQPFRQDKVLEWLKSHDTALWGVDRNMLFIDSINMTINEKEIKLFRNFLISRTVYGGWKINTADLEKWLKSHDKRIFTAIFTKIVEMVEKMEPTKYIEKGICMRCCEFENCCDCDDEVRKEDIIKGIKSLQIKSK